MRTILRLVVGRCELMNSVNFFVSAFDEYVSLVLVKTEII